MKQVENLRVTALAAYDAFFLRGVFPLNLRYRSLDRESKSASATRSGGVLLWFRRWVCLPPLD
jgi:hypothetical protein